MSAHFTPLIPAQTISVDGININYSANLLSNASFTVVLIHGFGASLETWSDIYPLLCAHYSIIRLDLKGSGFSGKPKDNHYAPSDQARLLASFLRALNQTHVVLVGHSLGGGIALLTYFDSKVSNSGIDVKGLVLIDSAGYSQNVPFFVSTVRNPLTRFVSHLLRPYDRVRFVLDRIIKVKEQVTPERIYRYAYFLDMPGSRYALLQTAKQIRPHNASELAAQFSTLTAPTLIVWGSDDPVILVANAYRFNSDIPGSRLVVFPDTGHIPHEERARQMFTILDEFLRSV